MYYIIETQEQLSKFKSYDFSKCIVDVIPNNDHWHLHLSYVCLLYIRPFKSKSGFILPITHSESTGISYEDAAALISNQIGQIYAVDINRVQYYFKKNTGLFCLKTAYYLKEGVSLSESTYDTTAHRFFNNRYGGMEDINLIIPISKHYEKVEAISTVLKKYVEVTTEDYFHTYSVTGPKVFRAIERNGIKVDKIEFAKHFVLKHELASFQEDIVYTSYNLFTSTGRPSNAFNGVNFAALGKENKSRKSFIPRNGVFVEFDYASYHLKILCNLINYEFDDTDIHTHLAKYYFDTSTVTPEQYAEGKQLTFKLLYTDSNIIELEDMPFFIRVKEFKHMLWNKYKKDGHINSFLSGRPLKNIDTITQMLPYVLQNYETERNITVLSKIHPLLNRKKSKLVLYCYDSFLFDYSTSDGAQLLEDITAILEDGGYNTSIKYGKNYNDLKPL